MCVDLFIKTAPAQVDDLRAEWDREPWDAIVADELSIGAAFYSEKSGMPVGHGRSAATESGGHGGSAERDGHRAGRNSLTKLRDAALRTAVPLLVAHSSEPIAQAREAGRAAGIEDGGQIVFSPRLVARADRPSSTTGAPTGHRLCTSSVSSAEQRPPRPNCPRGGRDLDGRTVVHVTQGTQNIDPSDLIRPALEALAERDVLVVVATGVPGHDTLPFAVPATCGSRASSRTRSCCPVST